MNEMRFNNITITRQEGICDTHLSHKVLQKPALEWAPENIDWFL